MWWGHQIGLALIVNFVHTVSSDLASAGKFCVVDPTLPEDKPGNSYYCPAYDDDGMANTYTDCCEEGLDDDYRKCCESTELKDERRMQVIKDMGIYVGIATGCLLIVIFVFTYCRSDTYPCVGALQRRAKYCKDACLDAICFCDCFKSKRKTQRRLEATKLNQIEPLCDSQEQLVVPMVILEEKPQFFW